MLIAHKIIDTLRGQSTGYQVLSTIKNNNLLNKHKDMLARAITTSEKFDFGDVHLEPFLKSDVARSRVCVNESGWVETTAGILDGVEWSIPQLSDDEKGFWVDGLIPLPAPLCWYEFIIGGTRSCLLIEEDNKVWTLTRVDLVNKTVTFANVWVTADRRSNHPLIPLNFSVDFEAIDKNSSPNAYYALITLAGGDMALAIYLTLMLNSKTTETTRDQAPPKLNKARIARKVTPLFDHRIVRIVPYQYRRTEATSSSGGHASPRLHWRRSHKRHYETQTAGSKYMETEVWSGVTGWWVTIIPRFLVGKAELGEVSHEYRVVK